MLDFEKTVKAVEPVIYQHSEKIGIFCHSALRDQAKKLLKGKGPEDLEQLQKQSEIRLSIPNLHLVTDDPARPRRGRMAGADRRSGRHKPSRADLLAEALDVSDIFQDQPDFDED